MTPTTSLALTCVLGLAVGAAAAQPADCPAIENDLERLACYDRAASREGRRPPDAVVVAPAPPAPVVQINVTAAPRKDLDGELGATLASRWELDPSESHGTFLPRAYKPIYVLPVVYTTAVNRQPTSPNPANVVPIEIPLNPTEAKFQISLKVKLAEGLFNGNGDVWAGYTQSSRWQVYNAELSRPFHETNYEPEAMLVFRSDYTALGLHGRLLGLSLNHQSNGRADPISRSWNRVIGMAGFEDGDWTMMLRPWWRIPETAQNDNNPDIEDYLGRAEAVISRRWGGHLFSVQLRHTLRGGANSRGSAEFDWAFPIMGNLKGQIQLFSGFGESLIDYNFRQTRLGLGVSLVEWR